MFTKNFERGEIESPYARLRLGAALLIMTIGGSGMYGMAVALPLVQADFGATRGAASLPYTLTMLGFGLGGILMGRMADRFGIYYTCSIGALGLGAGFALAGSAESLLQFILAHGLIIGLLGCSTTFGPLIADTSMWFDRNRGVAVGICASGNYVAGAVWPPILHQAFEAFGWRATYLGVGAFCTATILLLALLLRRRPPLQEAGPAAVRATRVSDMPLGLSKNTLMTLLAVAGLGCCVAMAMPQVHIVAYCGDLGYGPARGAEMLSLMLGCGIVSRLVSGWISDYIGGLRTLMLGSVLQGLALVLFLPFDGLASLYVVSALFGLFQGGLVPAYTLIIREYFAPREAGARVGMVIMATLLGMALGGWMSGAIFDLTGSYRAAFLNSIAFNLLNFAIVAWLVRRAYRRAELLPA